MAARPAAADFRDGDCTRAADDQISLGKSLRHVVDEGHNLRVDFTPRIGHANRIIVAFTGLMHDEKLIFSRGEKIQRVDDSAIDGQRALAAAGDQDVQRLGVLAGLDREEFRAHGTAGDDGFLARRACAVSPKPVAMRVAMRARTRLVKPGSAFGSKMTLGIRRSHAASIIGPAA